MFRRAIHATKTKAHVKDATFIRFTAILHAEKICTQAIFLQSLCIPRKVTRHMTSDFDVCEVDQDVQMSFLSADLIGAEQQLRRSGRQGSLLIPRLSVALMRPRHLILVVVVVVVVAFPSLARIFGERHSFPAFAFFSFLFSLSEDQLAHADFTF